MERIGWAGGSDAEASALSRGELGRGLQHEVDGTRRRLGHRNSGVEGIIETVRGMSSRDVNVFATDLLNRGA